MTVRFAAVAAATLLALAASARAEGPPPAQTAPAILAQLALTALPAATGATPLTVTSPAFHEGGDIPFENTRWRANIFPGLAWTPGPEGTKVYAVIMQDPDSTYQGRAILHWTMFNIPRTLTSLPAGMTEPPSGAANGPNVRGPAQPYMGPHTPPGSRHHYHFQVFALDAPLPDTASGSWDALTGPMKGHVLASGELIGMAYADPLAAPPANK
jgi:Raf kinase inhibitor-like YbhB/YbcL family protein